MVNLPVPVQLTGKLLPVGVYFLNILQGNTVMTCIHRNPETQECALVLSVLGQQAPRYLCSPKHEAACTNCKCPHSYNYISGSMIVNSARLLLPPEKIKEINRQYLPIATGGPECEVNTIKHLGQGPGTELHDILATWGWEIEPNCPCLRHIWEMNKSGPKWVLDSLDTIGSWLVEEFNRRHPALAKIPFANILTIDVAVRLVRRAVERYNLKSNQPTST